MLRYLRKRMQLSQEELGRTLGYSRTMVTRLENGERAPDPGMVKTVFVDALGLDREPALAARLITLATEPHRGAAVMATPSVEQPRSRSLPFMPTRFIGREQEIDALLSMMARHRMVTLTGSGGVGKTRLAIELARTIAADQTMPVCFADFSANSDDSLIPTIVAKALGMDERLGVDPTQQLVTRLGQTPCLLILDNCEHLINACAAIIEALLRDCPALRVLATSREALRIAGEFTWRVRPLRTPDPEAVARTPDAAHYEAIRLFTERAVAGNADFVLDNQNLHTVAQICQQLDGIPLAIEMAAAQMIAHSIDDIALALHNQLELLTSGERGAAPRHRTMRATLDWSYGLLSSGERDLLAALSVFAGGWTAEAAQTVCGAELADLRQLVRKSMVVANTGESPTRYAMLETVRQYAAERLRENGVNAVEDANERHLDYFLHLCEETMDLGGRHVTAWMRRVEADFANIRAAFGWSRSRATRDKGEAMLRLAAGLRPYRHNRGGLREGLAWLDEALAIGVDAPDLARALALLAHGTNSLLIDYEHAVGLIKQSLALFEKSGHKAGIACALETISMFEWDPIAAARAYTLFLELGSIAGQARVIKTQANIALEKFHDPVEATRQHQCALALGLEIRDRNVVYLCLLEIADTQPALALMICEREVAALSEADELDYHATLTNALGRLYASANRLEKARAILERSMTLWRDSGNHFAMHAGVGPTAEALGLVHKVLGNRAQAIASWTEAIHSTRLGIGDVLHIRVIEGQFALLREDYDQALVILREVLLRDYHRKQMRALSNSDFLTGHHMADIASAMIGLGNRVAGFRLMGAAAAIVSSSQYALLQIANQEFAELDYIDCLQTIQAARDAMLGDEPAIWAAGAAMGFDEAVAVALEAK